MKRNSRVKHVKVIGVIASYAFQRAKYIVVTLHRSMPLRFPAPEIEGLLEMEWNEKLMEWRHLYGPPFFRLNRPVSVFMDGRFIGSDNDLLNLMSKGNIFFDTIPQENSDLMKKSYREEYLSRLRNTKLIHCYFDISVDNNFIGTLVFQLYSDILPKTCENFTTLCLGTKGSFFSYKGSRIHRIVKNGWLQGGDIEYKTGGGGYSIYKNPLEDECYGISHNRRGVLSMANDGRHTNGSQFFITLDAHTWMDTRYVAFGQVIEGVKVLNYLENINTFQGRPLKKIEIINCGKLNLHDVDDTDAMYKQDMRDAAPKKRPKKIETIADQVARLVMEAVTECLAIKEYMPDILHSGDVPSDVNLDLYFQGMYSLPEEILEGSAKYLRMFRRELLRQLKPSATEVVEVIAYDLLEATFTKFVDLDDVRETTEHPIYQKLVDGIDMKVEISEKKFVKKFIDQLVNTAENMLKLISLKLNWMRKRSIKTQVFQEQMNDWVESFALQETFAGDSYRIAERPEYVPQKKLGPCDEEEEVKSKPLLKKEKEEEPCCGEKKIQEKKKKKIGKEQTAVEICCYGKDEEVMEYKISDFFSSCWYDIKKKKREEERIPILDLIEFGRYKLRLMRHQEERFRSKARICLEKRINKWMKDIAYVSEIDWIRQTVFGKEDDCLSHTEEIMYGAMTVGLLEMYYLVEQYLKRPKRKKYRTRIVYPEDDELSSVEGRGTEDSVSDFVASTAAAGLATDDNSSSSEKRKYGEQTENRVKGKQHKPCTCGDICCDCTSAPDKDNEEKDDLDECDDLSEGYEDNEDDIQNDILIDKVPPTPPPSPDKSFTLEKRDSENMEDREESCAPSEAELQVEELLAEIMGVSTDKINMKSFKWLEEYILNNSCALKSDFAGQVHAWLDTEIFNYKGFYSKHSLVTKASLLSFSLSLASLIEDENNLKSEIKDFVYDLWFLYFLEMFKEAYLEFPPELKEGGGEREEEEEGMGEEEEKETTTNYEDGDYNEPCKKIMKQVKDDFDFEKFCRENVGGIEKEYGSEHGEMYEKYIIMDETPQTDENMEMKEEQEKEEKVEETNEKEPEGDVIETEVEQVLEHAITNHEEILRGEDYEEEVKIDEMRSQTEEKEPIFKRKRPPILIRELLVSSEELRKTSPYELPFWIKFLSEVTKRALGLISKISRLPRRLYFTSDSQISFEDKMKAWIEFNNFSPPTTGVRDIKDFIVKHHVSLEDLDKTARSFLRKKLIVEVIEKSSRTNSAEILAEELVLELIMNAMSRIEEGEGKKILPDTVWEGLIAAAAADGTEYDADDMMMVELKDTDEVTNELYGEE